jgi:hypothetical protein
VSDPKAEPQFVGCTGAILKPFMNTRKDYGPQGCAEQGVKMIGTLGLLTFLVLKIKRTRKS